MKIKKSISLLLVAAVTISMLIMPAFADQTSNSSDFTITNGVLTTFNGSGGDVIIPNSVTSIGDSAFNGCTGLTSITIPNSVTSIGDSAFSGCTGLRSITILNSVTSIGNDAFTTCTSLTSITIPNSVTSIGDWAFWGCTGLKSVTILNSVTSIGGNAFGGCTNLMDFTIPSRSTISIFGFEIVHGVLTRYDSMGGDVVIPNGVTSISEEAFYNCTGLKSVIIPNSVTSIGDSGFEGCSSLTSITIPSSVTSIGDTTFWGCTSLKSITIPDRVTCISDYMFHGCTGLTSVTIPDSVTSIGYGTFYNCTNLKSITIPSSVKEIGSDALGFYEKGYSICEVYRFTINGFQGSCAQAYAKSKKIIFNVIQPQITLDKPSGTYTSNITVSGWAISPNGVSRVDIYVDGKGMGSVLHSDFTERTDIESNFANEGYNDLAHSGFSYTITKGTLKNGTYSIHVAEIDNKGKVVWSATKQFIVKF